ncbi:MAG TPA: DMT family transporter [Stellaceae bacterium]|nr:DMT family transporter [Stellaceae bacterium]
MSPTVVGLLLLAAMLHATWNAVLRSGADRLWSITVMSVATTVLALPCILFLPLPASASWPYIAVSSVLQLGYSIFLVRAYQHGELGAVYPIARGSAPLFVVLGALVFAHEHLSPVTLASIALLSLGIMALSRGVLRPTFTSIRLALTTGLFIASYTVSDGIGTRLSGNPMSYAAWIFIVFGTLMPLAFLVIRRNTATRIERVGRVETVKALLGGTLSLATYFLVTSALALAPIGAVSALRETSVVFAALIGRAFLGEDLTKRRLGACAMIACGAIFLSYRP